MSASRQRGFQFPGRFEITAVGAASFDLPALVPRLLHEAGLEVVADTLRQRASRQGNYVSVSVTVHCPSRQQYETAHQVLRRHDAIRYTL